MSLLSLSEVTYHLLSEILIFSLQDKVSQALSFNLLSSSNRKIIRKVLHGHFTIGRCCNIKFMKRYIRQMEALAKLKCQSCIVAIIAKDKSFKKCYHIEEKKHPVLFSHCSPTKCCEIP